MKSLHISDYFNLATLNDFLIYLIMRVDFHQGFLNNIHMGLAFYHIHFLSEAFKEELTHLLYSDLNLEGPVVFDLRKLSSPEQSEALSELENFFRRNNLSPRFPYPIYALSDLEINSPIIILKTQNELPEFFLKRSSKMSLKETHLSERNTLLQREMKNSDPYNYSKVLNNFSTAHKKIFNREQERLFYESVLERLKRRHKSDK